MFCPKCGVEVVTPSPSFCPNCGEILSVAQPAPTASPSANAKAKAVSPDKAEPTTDPKAVTSMLLGVLSISILLSIFAGIPAVILGHLARASIRRSNGRLKGEGMAMAGLIMGYISLFLLPVFASVVYVAVPNLFRSKIANNEAAVVETLKTIHVAAASYQLEHDAYPANLQELSSEGLVALDSQLASAGVQSGYQFAYKPTAAQKGYVIHADPVFIHTGQRHFYMDASGVIRYETAGPAGPNSQSVSP